MNNYLLAYFIGLFLGVFIAPATVKGKLLYFAVMAPIAALMLAFL